MSAATAARLDDELERFRKGERIEEMWNYNPNGVRLSANVQSRVIIDVQSWDQHCLSRERQKKLFLFFKFFF